MVTTAGTLMGAAFQAPAATVFTHWDGVYS